MFKQYFGMKCNPFNKELDTKDFYESRDLKELDSRLKYMLGNRGICLVVGEPGSGKSAALRRFCEALAPSLYKPCCLSLTTLTVNDFYAALAFLLGEEPRHRKIDMFRQIQTGISNLYFEQRITPVIVIDEIHMASSAVLEDIRMLFNFRMDSQNPFVLILSGQPVIRSKLSLNICIPLKQRIGVKYSMQGLSLDETEAYLKSRMTLSGVTAEVFSREATENIHASSGGYPRNINNIAVTSLMYCAGKNLPVVGSEAVYQANTELAI
jgi:type II secretory pathway predicted ATPase ExeA